MKGGAALERRHRVDCPPQPGVTLRPIEAAGMVAARLRCWRACIDTEQDRARVVHLRRYQHYAATALRKAEGTSVDRPVGPGEPHRFKFVGDHPYRPAAIEVEHEGHVLQHHPLRRLGLSSEQVEHVPDQARIRP